MALAILSYPWRIYSSLLETKPFTTKSITSGIMYMAGDLTAQAGEHYNAKKEYFTSLNSNNNSNTNNKNKDNLSAHEGSKHTSTSSTATTVDSTVSSTPHFPSFRINWTRAGIFFVYGTVIAGPLYHIWFDRLDRLPAAMYRLRQHRHRNELLKAYATLRKHNINIELPRIEALPVVKPFHKYTEKAMKIAADQFVFSSLYNIIFFMSIGLLNGAVEKYQEEDRRHSVETVSEIIRNRLSKKNSSSSSSSSSSSKQEDQNSRLRRDLLRIRSLLQQTDVEDDSIDRVLSLLHEEEQRHPSIEWSTIWHNSLSHLKEVYWATFIADCIVWPPLQLINFTFIPLRFQVLYVNLCNLGWNTFLSFMANKSH